jgi:hypothetical protein
MRWRLLVVAVLSGLSLTGCSAFVPSWNAQPTPIEIDNETEVDDVNEVPQSEPDSDPEETEEPTESEQVAEEEPEEPVEPVERETVNVEVISAMAYVDEGQLEVIAQVFDVVEDAGECTLKLLAGDFSTELTVAADRSSNYTQCAPMDIPLSELPGGTAVVSVSYLSDNYEGESSSVSVVIP